MKIYKFLEETYAINNLAFRRLKVSRINELNDPFELLGVDLLDPRNRRAVMALKDQLDETTGLICFSNTWQNPVLWGHYAKSHTGIALGFEIPDNVLHKVKYTSKRVALEFDTATRRVVDGKNVVDNLLRTKFRGWAYEGEYRMYVELDPKTEEAGIHFVDFSGDLRLVEVVLGMNCKLSKRRVQQLLGDDSTKVFIKKAGMALREYKMTEDRNFRDLEIST